MPLGFLQESSGILRNGSGILINRTGILRNGTGFLRNDWIPQEWDRNPHGTGMDNLVFCGGLL